MSSNAQINANRSNAQHSTGPKSPEGIANCKLNATKHGLTGIRIVIAGENADEYDALRESLLDTYAPSTEVEAMLVEEVAQNYWRLQRARRVEAEIISRCGEFEIITDPGSAIVFQRITRYLNRIQRDWTTARKDLAKLQSTRAKLEAKDAQPIEVRAPVRQIGSVLQPILVVRPVADPPPPDEAAQLATHHSPLVTG